MTATSKPNGGRAVGLLARAVGVCLAAVGLFLCLDAPVFGVPIVVVGLAFAVRPRVVAEVLELVWDALELLASLF